MSVKRFASIWNAASSPTALPALVVATAGMTTLWPSPARALVSAPRATPQRYGDRGAPERPCAPPPAGAPVGAAQVPKRLRFLLQHDGAVLIDQHGSWHVRPRTTQAPGPLPVGCFDCPHLRSAPSLVPTVWWPDAHHRLHHAQCRHPANTRVPQGRF